MNLQKTLYFTEPQNMHKHPKVSICLTSYNHAKYLRESIDSVLHQTFTDFELIIGDDASTDESWNIIQSYADPRIVTFRHETNKGGIIRETLQSNMASGDYVAIHHSDDIWEPDKLEKQVSFLDEHPEIGAVFSNATIIGEEGEPCEDKDQFYCNIFDQPNRSRYEWLNFFFYHGNALCHPSILIRKPCYENCGVYRRGLAQIPDLDMWIRLCLKYEIHVLPEKLVRFRVRSNGMNASSNRPDARIRGQFELLQVLDNYRLISTSEEFTKIFPNAKKYFRPAGFDIGFALGMVALEPNTYNVTKLFGLQLLFEAINDPDRLEKIKALYGFSPKDFIALTAKYDLFSIEVVANLNQTLAGKQQQMIALAEQYHEITVSKTWRATLLLRRVRDFLLPPGSLRMRLAWKMRPFLLFPFTLRQIYKRNRDLRLIRNSGLFDPDWYLVNNPDVAQKKIDPKLHYLLHGGFEGRDPSPNFRSAWYLETYKDVKKARTNPLIHYLLHGKLEGRDPMPKLGGSLYGITIPRDSKTEDLFLDEEVIEIISGLNL